MARGHGERLSSEEISHNTLKGVVTLCWVVTKTRPKPNLTNAASSDHQIIPHYAKIFHRSPNYTELHQDLPPPLSASGRRPPPGPAWRGGRRAPRGPKTCLKNINISCYIMLVMTDRPYQEERERGIGRGLSLLLLPSSTPLSAYSHPHT